MNRICLTCGTCGTFVDAPNSDYGRDLIENWTTLHDDHDIRKDE